MPRGDKSKYTDKQKRQAEHIAESYEERGVSDKTAEKRAWATVNKQDGGGEKSVSGRGRGKDTLPSKKGGRKRSTSTAAKSVKKKTTPKKPFAKQKATKRKK